MIYNIQSLELNFWYLSRYLISIKISDFELPSPGLHTEIMGLLPERLPKTMFQLNLNCAFILINIINYGPKLYCDSIKRCDVLKIYKSVYQQNNNIILSLLLCNSIFVTASISFWDTGAFLSVWIEKHCHCGKCY